jgi:hypothetical protein
MARGITYLSLVNKVLLRLREGEVNSVDDNAYSKMIGQFINAAKEEVESAWRWNDLRTSFLVATQAGVSTYALDNTDGRAEILDMWDVTNRRELRYASPAQMNAWYFGQAPLSDAPIAYSPNGLSSDGEFKFDVFPLPNSVVSLTVNAYAPTPELVGDEDRILCPWLPVLEGALARAYAERGEDGGTGSLTQQMIYASTLSSAIAIDANQNPGDLLWVAA